MSRVVCFSHLECRIKCLSIGCFLLPSRALGVAAYNLDLVRLELALVVEREVDIRKVEHPNFIAVAICIQVAL